MVAGLLTEPPFPGAMGIKILPYPGISGNLGELTLTMTTQKNRASTSFIYNGLQPSGAWEDTDCDLTVNNVVCEFVP